MPERLNDRLLSWASSLDADTREQAERVAGLPILAGHVALMPDAHLGYGGPVGAVIPTAGALVPAAVGVDIGCGMVAQQTVLTTADVPDLRAVLHRIGQAVPAGVGQGHDSERAGREWLDANPHPEAGLDLSATQRRRVTEQFGTLGSGNHFLTLCADPDDRVWIVLHSGSRGIGNQLAQAHIDRAKKAARRRGDHLADEGLAWVEEGTEAFASYVADLQWAQRYALANRERMVTLVLQVLAAQTRRDVEALDEGCRLVNCHHNYAARETYDGEEIWVTRKGAVRAGEGDLAIIPGAMGGTVYLAAGKGNPRAFASCAHGAGRAMSRRQAKRQFSEEDLAAAMGDRTWLSDRARDLLDEIPGAYKDLEVVMADQADLVEPVTRLQEILNYKGS